MHRCNPRLCPWPTSFCFLHITCRWCHNSWPLKYQLHCVLSSVRWWHSAVYWYLHSEGSQLAPELWSSPQSIQVWSHCFFNPRSKPIESLTESIASIPVAGSLIKLQSSIKNLGVYLGSRMFFDMQVSETCKASYFHIRALRHIRFSLTTEASKTTAVAMVGFRLDYCNSLLAGPSVSNLARLQLVQNTLARVVTEKSGFCHIASSSPDTAQVNHLGADWWFGILEE